ncbi:MAG: hydroxypyruvate isomerase [Gammaproteobacteria bacterium]|nr:MAG: hydroxypyruvate isomerase [Gammaproteobacteria bacterium]
MKFSANLSLLYTELPLPERFAAAARDGFGAVEIQFPYDEDPHLLRHAADAAGVPIVLINVPAGDLMSGGEGLACVPERRSAFREALEQCREVAAVLRPEKVNVLAGRCHDPARWQECLDTFVTSLELAAQLLSPTGSRIVFEGVNRHDMPGFLIATPGEQMQVLERLGNDACTLQVDLYHVARMGLPVAEELARVLPWTGHIQFADCPGRGEPGSGGLDFPALFGQLDQAGYSGWLGAEYHPTTPATADSLGWLRSREIPCPDRG